ncbi:MAG: SCO family protein [Gemmatimonadetes bacterium]|nr:SCO family protein [Gemmatimonadota bacterium]
MSDGLVAAGGRARGNAPGHGVAAMTLALILVITAGWWALALYPVGADVPSWVERTRAACFGTVDSGLPSAGGWVLLVGEPIGMMGVLISVWGESLRTDLAWLRRRWWGQAVMLSTVLAVSMGSVAAGTVVAGAIALERGETFNSLTAAAPVTRLDLPAPPLVLTDQHGEGFDLAAWRGRPVIVTFAFGHCADVCPTQVHQLREARRGAGKESVPIVVVTLDPWRDVPARLPHIAAQWELTAEDRVLSGEVADVNAMLDAWSVARARDPATGDIAHPPVALLVNEQGRIAARLDGGMDRMRDLLQGIGG